MALLASFETGGAFFYFDDVRITFEESLLLQRIPLHQL